MYNFHMRWSITKSVHIKGIFTGTILYLLAIGSLPATAEESATEDDEVAPVREPVSDLFTEAEAAPISAAYVADRTRKAAGSQVQRVGRWVDSFFDDPNYMADAAGGRIVVKQSIEESAKNSTQYQLSISGKLKLPELSNRLELVFEGNDDLALDEEDPESFSDSADQSTENPSIGLRYSFLDDENLDLRMAAGVRFGNQALFAGPRFRARRNIGGGWLLRYTQDNRWYTDDGWKIKGYFDFDRRIGKYNLFRQRLGSAWAENKYASEGFRHSMVTSFTQPLTLNSAVRYAWHSIYLSHLDGGWDSTEVNLAYRRCVWRKWVVIELKPFLAFEDENDWEANPGTRLSMSLIFEDDGQSANPVHYEPIHHPSADE